MEVGSSSSMVLEEEKNRDVLESVNKQVVTHRPESKGKPKLAMGKIKKSIKGKINGGIFGVARIFKDLTGTASLPVLRSKNEIGSTSMPTVVEELKVEDVLECSVNIEDLHRGWLSSLEEKLDIEPRIIKPLSSEISCAIHRVPQCFRQHYEKEYVPQIISIGPFHYDKRKDQLRAMEDYKWMYLRALVNRQERKTCLKEYLLVVMQLENRVRKCYSEEIDLDSHSFAEMMVLDACFLIELFYRAMSEDKYKEDPILRFGWLKSAITSDLLKLENQIPFFILKYLITRMDISDPGIIVEMARTFFDLPVINDPSIDVLHLLHLLHYSRLPLFANEPGAKERINNASKLRESGIKFKKGDENGFLDIRFEKGVITIPPLKVEDTTNPLFLNLVAFEQCYRHVNSYFAGYTYFMDCLIDTANDVKILCQNGIIDRWLGSDEDVANLFNKIGREVIVYDHDFYLSNVCDQINRHHRTNWNVWRATLMRTYFNNPWAIISVFAAVVFLLLTLTQTFLAAAQTLKQS